MKKEELTYNEKMILALVLNNLNNLIEMSDGCLFLKNGITFDSNNLFNLCCKLGIEEMI